MMQGRVQSISDGDSGMRVYYDYDSECGCGGMQIISKITREDGSYVEYDYDHMGQLIDEAYHSPTAVSLAKFGYTYDKDGNRLSKSYHDAYGDSVVLSFKGFGPNSVFDASNRLKSVIGNTGKRINATGTVSDIGSGIGSVWVTPNGDVIKKVQADIVDGLWIARGIELDVGDTNSIYATAYDDAGNTAMDFHDTISLDDDVSITYIYDSKGNLTQRHQGAKTDTFTYYQTGLLESAADGSNTETYYYNALGQRYMIVSDNGTSVDTRTFVFSESGIIREFQDSDTVTYENFSAGGLGGGIGSIAYSKASNDTITFYTYNHKGDVYALVDDVEDLVACYDYDAWGNLMTAAIDNSTDNDFTFSTREFSDVSGLGHWPVREYDPFTGRWTRVDPAGDVDGLNLYVFVSNRPSDGFDKLGKKGCTVVVYAGHFSTVEPLVDRVLASTHLNDPTKRRYAGFSCFADKYNNKLSTASLLIGGWPSIHDTSEYKGITKWL
jgi:RHS repeat-associated protein